MLIHPFISPDTHTHKQHTHANCHTHRQKQAKSICNGLNKGGGDWIRKLLTVINNDKAAGSTDSHREVMENTNVAFA